MCVSEALVELMLTIVQIDSSCCHTPHIAVLLGAYTATMSYTGTAIP